MWISLKVFPGVRVGGRIGGRKRRRVGGYRSKPPRKPLPTPVKVGIGVFGVTVAVWAYLTSAGGTGAESPGAAATTAPTTSAGQVVHRADISPWPLNVSAVTLACVDRNETTAEANGVVYALNPYAALAGRWANLTPLLVGPITDQRTNDGLAALVNAGDKLC